jgi:hypothetical protein
MLPFPCAESIIQALMRYTRPLNSFAPSPVSASVNTLLRGEPGRDVKAGAKRREQRERGRERAERREKGEENREQKTRR